MRKQFLCRICILLLCCLLLQPLAVNAAVLDVDRPCSLSLTYANDGVGFSGVEVRAYRIAEAYSNGGYALIPPYSSYPVNIYTVTSQKEWKDMATTLSGYIAANGHQPDSTGTTDGAGQLVLANLKPGLYLVGAAVADNAAGIYTFDEFMVYIPTPLDDGTYDYDVEAKPKCIGFVPKEEYKVVKLWKDSGFAGVRPKSVTIDILRNDVVQESVELSADNNWSYTWRVSVEDTAKWSVVERDVPDSYKVSVSENTGVFTITNTRTAVPGVPPKTGDSFALWPWVMTFCLSGSLLVLFGYHHKRKRA